MKFYQIILILFLTIFLVSCSSYHKKVDVEFYQEKYSCSNLCNNNTELTGYIYKKFNLDSSNYTLICSDCNLGKVAGDVKALIIKNESLISLYYRRGSCDNGLDDCGSSITIAIFNDSYDSLYDEIKDEHCSKLRSIQYGGDRGTFSCDNEFSNKSLEIRESCFNGDFETKKNGWDMFAFKENSNRCESTSEIGDFTVFDWVN